MIYTLTTIILAILHEMCPQWQNPAQITAWNRHAVARRHTPTMTGIARQWTMDTCVVNTDTLPVEISTIVAWEFLPSTPEVTILTPTLMGDEQDMALQTPGGLVTIHAAHTMDQVPTRALRQSTQVRRLLLLDFMYLL
jgi:hypothetical protein